MGKSTFFNRLVQSRQAIVEETSGVTRDRHYGHSDWNGKSFTVIDTGGYVVGSDDIFEAEIRKQVNLAIDEADVIIFVVDGQEGLHPLDEDVAAILRRCKNTCSSPRIKRIFRARQTNPQSFTHSDSAKFMPSQP